MKSLTSSFVPFLAGNEGLICAGTMQHDMECAMDSGSPLVCAVNDRSTVSTSVFLEKSNLERTNRTSTPVS